MQILSGHISPETAYVVDDYPYGFRLRCKIRYWIEYSKTRGFRFMSQTTDPRKGNVTWNKPKASTYARFGGAMFLNDIGHVEYRCIGEYSNAKEAQEFLDVYGEGVPEVGKIILRKWVATKIAYESNRKPEDGLVVGLIEARKAWNETK